MSLTPKTLLNKRYRIESILGQGGMSSVYRAYDENIGVPVAVKENLVLTDDYAKLQTKGKTTLEKINRFTESGVPILDALAKNLKVSKYELFKMISAGKLGFKDVDIELTSMATGTTNKEPYFTEKSNTLRRVFASVFASSLEKAGNNIVLTGVAKNAIKTTNVLAIE